MEQRVLHRSAVIRRMVMCIGILITAGCVGAADPTTVQEARDKLAEFDALAKSLSQPLKDGEAPTDRTKDQEKTQQLLAETRQLFDSAHAGESNDSAILKDYARVLQMSGDVDLACESLRKALKKRANDADGWFNLAVSLYAWGPTHHNEALDALRRSTDIDPGNPSAAQAHALRGRIYIEQQLYDFAQENFAKALEVNPDNITAKIGQAALNIRDGKVAEASAVIDALGMLPPAQATMLDTLLRESLIDFARARRFFPDTVENHLAYAKLLFRANRASEALAPLLRCVKLDPKNYVAWNMVASVSRESNDTTSAITALRRSLEANPDQPRTIEILKSLESSAPPATQ